MRRFFPKIRSRSAVISLAVIYAIFVLLVVLVASQIVVRFAEGEFSSSIILIGVVLLIPLFLLALMIVYFVNILRNRATGNVGASFRIRLLTVFVLVALAASVPQILLSFGIVRTLFRSWIGPEIGTALSNGIELALDYYEEHVAVINSVAESRLLDRWQQSPSYDSNSLWRSLSQQFPRVSAVQIFSEEQNGNFFAGSEIAYLDRPRMGQIAIGLPIRDTILDRTFLRYKLIGGGSPPQTLVISVNLPAEFDRKARSLTTTAELFGRIDTIRPQVPLLIVLFFGIFSLPLFLLAVLASILISNDMARPIQHLEEATRHVIDGNYSYRILFRPRALFATFAHSFNHMIEELARTRTRLLQTDRVETWQEIAQQLAHEIKNPLTPIKLSATRVLSRYQTKSDDFGTVFESSIRTILREVDVLTDMLDDFRNFSRPPIPHPQTVLLKPLLIDAAKEYSDNPDLQFQFDEVEEMAAVCVDPGQLRQVFVNLFRNSVEAMEQKGSVIVLVDPITRGTGEYYRIQFIDSGPGIDLSVRDRVFSPYFTTKPHGAGLGLPIIERIVTNHGGTIWFESKTGAGTIFYLDIPKNR